jgi:hypothetical protein
VKRGARNVLLATNGEENFLPLVTSFVEKAALCFGLGRNEALELTLAAEEIFIHLCRVVMPKAGPLEIHCSSGGYCVQADFSFRADELDLRAFNLTTAISLEDESEFDGMGLVIASRSVDRFRLSREKGQHVRLCLVKEKSYPLLEEDPPAAGRPLTEFVTRSPTPEEVKFITRLARSCYPGQLLSDYFQYPGKLVDMIGSGEYQAVAAVGPAGELGGAMLWHWIGHQTVECFGPYVFNQDPESAIPESLVEGCIGAIARTHAVGLLNTRPTPQLPEHHFEKLGTLTVHSNDGSSMPLQAWFRLMREDTGCVVWVHADLQDFIQGEYRRLVLPREVRPAQNAGESRSRHSVISAEFDRLQGRVILRPMWPGGDCEENIAEHVRLLRQELIPNIFFTMDLGQAWQADFAPGLLRNAFVPCYVLPYAGKADVILFQHREARP